MKKENLAKVILKNGGFTNKNIHNKRYVIGNGNLYTGKVTSEKDILRVLEKVEKTFKYPLNCLGYWIDNKNVLFIDIITTRESIVNALLVAYTNGEQAIYDQYLRKTIYLNEIKKEIKEYYKKTLELHKLEKNIIDKIK